MPVTTPTRAVARGQRAGSAPNVRDAEPRDPGRGHRLATLVVVVLAAALLVRLLYVLSIRNAYFFDHLQTEPQHYDAWATAILSGDAPVHLPFDEAPGYPYLVALIYAMCGHSVLAVVLFQAALGAAGCAAIAVCAWRFAGTRAAWLAGGLAAIYGPFIYFTGQLEPATLAVLAASVALAVTPSGPATPRRWWMAGVAWGATIVVRSELAFAVPFALAHAWLVAGPRAASRIAVAPALLLIGSLAANTIASGHPVVLTTGSGVNLWLGNNTAADGVSPFVHGPLQHVVREAEASSNDPVEIDRAFRMRAELSGSLVVKKLVWTFTHRELPNAADISWQTAQSWVFQPPVFPIGFGIVFPLACVGAMLGGRRWRARLVLAGPIAAGLVACVVFFTNARFRIVMLPPLIVLAAFAIDAVVTAVPGRNRRTAALAALAAGIALAWPDYYRVKHYRIAQIDVNTGTLERGAGHLDRAALYLRSALALEPHDASAWVELALVLEQLGDREAARAAWSDAISHVPDDPDLRELAIRHLQ